MSKATETTMTVIGVGRNILRAAATAASDAQPLPALSPVALLQQPAELLPPVAAGESVEIAVDVDQMERSPSTEIPIDLPTALAITTGQNPQVAFARQRIQELFAKHQAANVLWVPTLRGWHELQQAQKGPSKTSPAT